MADEMVTALLGAAGSGDDVAFQRLYERSYDELRRLAHVVRQSHSGETINTTALVHEAYLKLIGSERLVAKDRIHFFRIVARAMRQVLIDAARRHHTRRRCVEVLGTDDATAPSGFALSTDLLALNDALAELEAMSPRQASVVECRFFAGLSVEETADALEVSTPTVKRDWRVARAFLAQTLGAAPQPSQ